MYANLHVRQSSSSQPFSVVQTGVLNAMDAHKLLTAMTAAGESSRFPGTTLAYLATHTEAELERNVNEMIDYTQRLRQPHLTRVLQDGQRLPRHSEISYAGFRYWATLPAVYRASAPTISKENLQDEKLHDPTRIVAASSPQLDEAVLTTVHLRTPQFMKLFADKDAREISAAEISMSLSSDVSSPAPADPGRRTRGPWSTSFDRSDFRPTYGIARASVLRI